MKYFPPPLARNSGFGVRGQEYRDGASGYRGRGFLDSTFWAKNLSAKIQDLLLLACPSSGDTDRRGHIKRHNSV